METQLEYILTNSHKAAMIASIKAHPLYFKEALQLALADRQPYSWRAAWVLWSCMDKNDKRVNGYIDKIIEVLPYKKYNQQRELMMILQRMELNDSQQGKLFDISLNIWTDTEKQPSVRFNAFKLMVKILNSNPELYNEIRLYTQSHYISTLTAGAKKVILKQIQELNKKYRQ